MVDIIVFFNKIQIVHRDIRPHNIIVVDNKIKVIDFEHCSINNLKMKDSPLELNKDFSPKGAKWDDAYSFKKVVDYYVDKDKLRDSSDYQKLKDGLAKLQLNDASFSYEPESSSALGLGFRCGFLGLLHLEIITERLEREFDINLITTTPGVVYKVYLNNEKILELQNPSSLPDPTLINYIEEPWIKATIITPDQYLGSIIKMCQSKRGVQTNLSYSGNRAVINYELPLNEVVFDFNDRLKSMTSGYASFDYEIIGHKEGELVKMGILVNGESVDALAMMIHKDFAQSTGREVCEKLKDLIPRHNFMIPIQAAIGGKIIARETIKGFKKDVLTKIHGGGATDRKRKLLEKQKKGKARAKQFGKVEIPQEAFIGVLKINKEK